MVADPLVGVYRPEEEKEGENHLVIDQLPVVFLPVSMDIVVVFPAPLWPRRAVI